jgi:hypothetical protein
VEWHDKAYLVRFKYRELSTRSVTAARAEIRGGHNFYADPKGQTNGSVPDTPKRSQGARQAIPRWPVKAVKSSYL